MPDLTPKQARFVEEYLIDLNTTQAAIRAGYSEKTARSVGHETRMKPYIAQAIAKKMEARSERTEITQDRVLQEYGRIGFMDIRRAVHWGEGVLVRDAETGQERIANGVSLVASDDLDEDTAAAVAEVSQAENGTLKIKLHDKRGALDSMARHLGMFVERHEHTGKDGGPIETRDLTDLEFARRVAFALMKGADGDDT